MMQYLLIGWIITCVMCISIQFMMDLTAEPSTGGLTVNGEEVDNPKFTGTWCVACSCMSLTISVMPLLITAMLSEKGLETLSDINSGGEYYSDGYGSSMGNYSSPPIGNYSPIPQMGNYSPMPSAPPKI
jgi:hypothetical protein